MPETSRFDILIAGAGPSGLALSLLLARQNFSIGIIEKQVAESLQSPSYDGREIALTQGSWRILHKIGAADRIDKKCVSRIREARVLNGKSDYALSFSAGEVQESNMGYMVSNHLIRRALYEEVLTHDNITILTGNEVVAAKTDNSGASVKLSSGYEVSSMLLVAADSRFSKIRDMMGISANRNDFERTCIVCRVRHEKNLHQTAYEIFGIERTMAVLPLENAESSLVLTLPADSAGPMMQMDSQEFIKNLAPDLAGHCGEMTLSSERFAYPLVGIHANKFQANRFVLMGDAAVGMHPVTAHGFNLGLSGAHILASEIEKGRRKGLDFWDARILAAYERRQKRKTMPLYHGTNALVKLYVRTGPISRIARHALLHAGNILVPAKRMIIRSLTDKAA